MRSRLCKSCGDWHSLSRPWPHNCRKPVDTPPQLLDAPMVAPVFQAFKTGRLDTAETIMNRHQKREYMKRNDLVEHAEGISNEPTWVDKRKNVDQYVADFKRFAETDPANISPDLKVTERVGETDLGGTADIATEGIAISQ